MAGNVLIKNANGNTVTLQNPDTNLVDVVVDTSKITSKQYVDDADALKVALSSFTGANQSLGSNGYQKLPGGLIVQWGTVSSGWTTSSVFNFPLAFPSSCFGCYPVVEAGSSPSTNQGITGVRNITTTTFQLDSTTVSAVDNNIKWFAIGY